MLGFSGAVGYLKYICRSTRIADRGSFDDSNASAAVSIALGATLEFGKTCATSSSGCGLPVADAFSSATTACCWKGS
jgi:hypothetical protein